MVWIIIIGVLLFYFFIFPFLRELYKDSQESSSTHPSEKFKVLISILNQSVFNGLGVVNKTDKNQFNLHEGNFISNPNENQIILFHYSTGILTITWKYKYFQREVVYKLDVREARNISDSEQNKIAENLITKMSVIVENHKRKVESEY